MLLVLGCGGSGTSLDASVDAADGSSDPLDLAVVPTCREGARELLPSFPAEDVSASLDGNAVAIAFSQLGSTTVELQVVDSDGETLLAPTRLGGVRPTMATLALYGIEVEASPLGYAVAWTQQLELDDLVFGGAGAYETAQAVVVDREGRPLVDFSRYGAPHDAYGHRVHSRRPQLLWMGSDVLFAWQDLRTRTRVVGEVVQDSGIYGVTLDTVAGSAAAEQLLSEHASSRNRFHLETRSGEAVAAIVTSVSRDVYDLSVEPLPAASLTPLVTGIGVRVTDLAVAPDGAVHVAFVRGIYTEATVEVGVVTESDLVTTTIGSPEDWSGVETIIAFHEGRALLAWVDGLEVGWRFLDDAASFSTTTIDGVDAVQLLDAEVTDGALRIVVARELDDTFGVDLIERCL